MARKYWLFKTEPDTFSIEDLAQSKGEQTTWEGVRNYQARNFLRDEVSKGDQVLFYHSNANPPGIVGTCEVTRSGYPDPTQFDPESDYFDPRADKANPRWYMVDVRLSRQLKSVLPLKRLKETPGLEEMEVTRKGSMLSIQPVTADEWAIVEKLMKDYE